MIVAVLTESHIDDAIVRILVDGVVGPTVPPMRRVRARPGGYKAVVRALFNTTRALHSQGVDGIVVAADADHSPVAPPPGGDDAAFRRGSRYWQLRNEFERAMGSARERAGQPPIWCAIGLAVPAIEAWLLDPTEHPDVSEATWTHGRRAYDGATLKERLYGSIDAPAATRVRLALAGARRAAADIDELARRFPIGFGTMASELRKHLADTDRASHGRSAHVS